ncbi:hypothetical protein POVWA2_014230 [Plasmodium ovale wallikeri]|uniref:RRM domain-containing protein n=1 Tax=Plasmodium ovale wallikeri TaxID=864142 RepID=A0A1A8YP14_PLAOA|nr:hypothetical protein POVWA2_014230 [Plasmodium ovale wallikeri]
MIGPDISHFFVSNLPFEVTEDELKEFFSPSLELTNCRLTRTQVEVGGCHGYLSFRNSEEDVQSFAHNNKYQNRDLWFEPLEEQSEKDADDTECRDDGVSIEDVEGEKWGDAHGKDGKWGDAHGKDGKWEDAHGKDGKWGDAHGKDGKWEDAHGMDDNWERCSQVESRLYANLRRGHLESNTNGRDENEGRRNTQNRKRIKDKIEIINKNGDVTKYGHVIIDNMNMYDIILLVYKLQELIRESPQTVINMLSENKKICYSLVHALFLLGILNINTNSMSCEEVTLCHFYKIKNRFQYLFRGEKEVVEVPDGMNTPDEEDALDEQNEARMSEQTEEGLHSVTSTDKSRIWNKINGHANKSQEYYLCVNDENRQMVDFNYCYMPSSGKDITTSDALHYNYNDTNDGDDDFVKYGKDEYDEWIEGDAHLSNEKRRTAAAAATGWEGKYDVGRNGGNQEKVVYSFSSLNKNTKKEDYKDYDLNIEYTLNDINTDLQKKKMYTHTTNFNPHLTGSNSIGPLTIERRKGIVTLYSNKMNKMKMKNKNKNKIKIKNKNKNKNTSHTNFGKSTPFYVATHSHTNPTRISGRNTESGNVKSFVPPMTYIGRDFVKNKGGLYANNSVIDSGYNYEKHEEGNGSDKMANTHNWTPSRVSENGSVQGNGNYHVHNLDRHYQVGSCTGENWDGGDNPSVSYLSDRSGSRADRHVNASDDTMRTGSRKDYAQQSLYRKSRGAEKGIEPSINVNFSATPSSAPSGNNNHRTLHSDESANVRERNDRRIDLTQCINVDEEVCGEVLTSWGKGTQVGSQQVGSQQVGGHQVGGHQVGGHQVGGHQVGGQQVGSHKYDQSAEHPNEQGERHLEFGKRLMDRIKTSNNPRRGIKLIDRKEDEGICDEKVIKVKSVNIVVEKKKKEDCEINIHLKNILHKLRITLNNIPEADDDLVKEVINEKPILENILISKYSDMLNWSDEQILRVLSIRKSLKRRGYTINGVV